MAQDLRPEPEMRPPPFPCSALTALDGPGIAAQPFHPVIQSAQGDHGVRGASVPPESSQSPVTPSRPGAMHCVHGNSPPSPDSLPSPSALRVHPGPEPCTSVCPEGPVAVRVAPLSLSFSGVFDRIPPGCEHVCV